MKTNIFFANSDKSGQVVRKVAALVIVFMLLFAAISCDTSKEAYAYDEMEEEPINVFFTELSLIGCRWTHIDNEVIIINSDEELEKYIGYIYCWNISSFPNIDVDFSKYTLLLVSGLANWDSEASVNNFQQLSANKYRLSVSVLWSKMTMSSNWITAVITSKLATQVEVEVKITHINK